MLDQNFSERLKRAENILSKVAEGDLNQNIDIPVEDDELTNLEIGINFMIMDLKANEVAIKEKEIDLLEQKADLEDKIEVIQRQAEAIKELSTPIMEVWDDILVLPVVGVVDTRRSIEIMNALLDEIVSTQSKCVIVDITGVEIVDTKTADYLLKIVNAADLLGAHCVLTGINPAVAQTLVEIGADLTGTTTLRNLKAGLIHCIKQLKKDYALITEQRKAK